MEDTHDPSYIGNSCWLLYVTGYATILNSLKFLTQAHVTVLVECQYRTCTMV